MTPPPLGVFLDPPLLLRAGCQGAVVEIWRSCRRKRIFVILAPEMILDVLSLRVCIKINDGTLANALNMALFPVLKRRLDHILLHSVSLFLHEHWLARQTDTIKTLKVLNFKGYSFLTSPHRVPLWLFIVLWNLVERAEARTLPGSKMKGRIAWASPPGGWRGHVPPPVRNSGGISPRNRVF